MALLGLEVPDDILSDALGKVAYFPYLIRCVECCTVLYRRSMTWTACYVEDLSF